MPGDGSGRSPEVSARHHGVFLAGAISGIAEGVTIQPLEMLKTRFQINTGQTMQLLPAVREVCQPAEDAG